MSEKKWLTVANVYQEWLLWHDPRAASRRARGAITHLNAALDRAAAEAWNARWKERHSHA